MPMTTKNFSDIITFTRTGSNATQFDSSGNLVFAPNNAIRNNTMQGAVAGTPGTPPTNWVVVPSGLTQTIVGTGTSAGVTYIDIRVNGTTTGAGGVQIKPDGNAGVIAATAAQAWAMSSWVAIVGGSTANTTGQRFVINEYSAGPTYLRTAVAATNILTGGATLTRVFGAITTGASTTILEPIVILDAASGAAIDITLRIGMPQLERGSVATAVNATSGTAYYGPRFDYDPATLAAQGLLIEEQRTNFFTNASGAINGSIGTGSVSGPDNVNCRTFIPTAGAVSFPNITGPVQTFTLSLGQTVDWAWSGWFSAGPVGSFIVEPRLIFNISVNNATSFTYAELQIDTTNWTVRQKSLPAGLTEVSAPTITLFKPGLYRVTWVVRYTQDATGRNNVSASIQARNTANSGTYTADGISGFQYALVQAETGSFVTSTIPTTTTALTRSADVASVNTLAPWYNSAAGTLFAEVQRPSSASNNGAMAGINDGTANNRLQTRIDGATTNTNFIVLAGAVNYGASFTFISGGVNKAALAYETNNVNSAGNGVVGTTDTSEVIPTGLTKLDLGQAIGAGLLNGHLRRITYYPRRLSNVELVSITS